MNEDIWKQIVVLLILLLLSGFFSSAETSLVAVSKIKIRSMAESGVKRAQTLMKIFENDAKMLSAILIGNNLVNTYAASIASMIALSFGGSAAVSVATFIITFLILVFGEITPKTIATQNAEKLALAKLDAMSDDELLAASLKRVGDDTEKLTRRHMMECVAEYIQTKCIEDPDFARKTMHPKKTMIRCYQYINRKAWEFVQDELKARGITPSRTEPYASSIPEDVCYQWAVDYFNTPDVQEDVEKEEKFVPKPYRSTTAATTKSTASKGETPDKAEGEKNMAAKETKPATPKKKDDDGQISFGGFAMPEAKAG